MSFSFGAARATGTEDAIGAIEQRGERSVEIEGGEE